MSRIPDIAAYNFFNQLKSLPFVDAIYLYGSRARGDAGERSDIDLAILCPNASASDWQTALDIIENADTLLKIDCVRLDRLHDGRLKQNIVEDGVKLYG